jgi:hypothetical protein
MGGSDDGNAHSNMGIPSWFLPLLGKQSEKFLQSKKGAPS